MQHQQYLERFCGFRQKYPKSLIMKSFSRQLCFLCGIAVAITVAQSLRQLRYALFTSGPEGDIDASGAVPAMELAEEYLLNSSLLSDYELKHSPVQDTLVSRAPPSYI